MGQSLQCFAAFDVDGTLLRWQYGKGLRLMVAAVEQTFQVQIPTDRLPDAAGKTDLQLLSELLALGGIPHPIAPERRERFFQTFARLVQQYGSIEDFQLLPGVRRLWTVELPAAGIGVGVVTGNARAIAQWKLSLFGLWQWVQVGSFGDEDQDRVALLSLFAMRLRQRYRKPLPFVVVGDTPADVRAARHFGVPVIAVATGPVSQAALLAAQPDVMLDSMEDVAFVQQQIAALCVGS